MIYSKSGSGKSGIGEIIYNITAGVPSISGGSSKQFYSYKSLLPKKGDANYEAMERLYSQDPQLKLEVARIMKKYNAEVDKMSPEDKKLLQSAIDRAVILNYGAHTNSKAVINVDSSGVKNIIEDIPKSKINAGSMPEGLTKEESLHILNNLESPQIRFDISNKKFVIEGEYKNDDEIKHYEYKLNPEDLISSREVSYEYFDKNGNHKTLTIEVKKAFEKLAEYGKDRSEEGVKNYRRLMEALASGIIGRAKGTLKFERTKA